jgi:hypothetical protein
MSNSEHSSVVAEGLLLYTGGWKAQSLLYIATFAISLTLALVADLGMGLDTGYVVQLAVLVVILLLFLLPLMLVIVRRFVGRRDPQSLDWRLKTARELIAQRMEEKLRTHALLPRQTLIRSQQWIATAREADSVYIDSAPLQLEEYVVEEHDFIISSGLEQ